MKKEIDERIAEGVLRWFGRVERMENDKIVKKVYTREYGRGKVGLIP